MAYLIECRKQFLSYVLLKNVMPLKANSLHLNRLFYNNNILNVNNLSKRVNEYKKKLQADDVGIY